MDTFSIGVDLGGTNLRIGAYSQNQGLLETTLLPTRLSEGRETVLRDMCAGIDRLRKSFSNSHLLRGIAVGTPGPLELPRGRLRNPPNLPGWDGLDLRFELERLLAAPVLVESDANLAALAEWRVGRGKITGTSSLCMLTLGTGVGNGIILSGKIWSGMSGMAGEAGHLTIDPDGPLCACGNRGCLEQYSSATAVCRMVRERIAQGADFGPPVTLEESFTAQDVYDLAHKGNSEAIQVFAEVGRALGIALADVINTLNLPLYVLGGGLAGAWDLFSPPLFEEVRMRSYVYRLTAPSDLAADIPAQGSTHIAPAELGDEAGLLGACILPFVCASGP